MKIVIIGATGTIGKAVAAALRGKHEVIAVSRSAADYRADITDKSSLEKAFAAIGKVDAIVGAAGALCSSRSPRSPTPTSTNAFTTSSWGK